MATQAQRQAAKKNIRKAQPAWKSRSSRQRARAQPQGRQRSKPGTTGEGRYFHVAVRPKTGFATFRTQDVGRPGHVQRVAGKRRSGSWDTVTWLISKEDAHVSHGVLVPDTSEARKVLKELGSRPSHLRGDRFKAKPRRNVPEREKPTPAQRKARRANIKKPHAARR